MRLLHRIFSLFGNLFRKKRSEYDLNEEVQSYLGLLIEKKIESGIDPKEATRLAFIELGGSDQIKERVREIRMGYYLETILQDLRYGIRMLIKTPVFTIVAILSLALGIGANTALFSLVDEVLLKSLPVKNPSQLVLFSWIAGKTNFVHGFSGELNTDPATGRKTSNSFSRLSFESFNNNETLSDVFAFATIEQLNVNIDGQATIANGQFVSGNYYRGLGVQTVVGRPIEDSDDKPGANPVAVITYRYWQRRFAHDPGALGKTITLNNVDFTIIGITPPEFNGALQIGESPDLSVPFGMDQLLNPGNSSTPSYYWLRVMGRLKSGVTAVQAQANLEPGFQQSVIVGAATSSAKHSSEKGTPNLEANDLPKLRATWGGQGLTSLREAYIRPLTILMVVVGLALLIACLNVANLMLARAATRHREIAVRLALGAGRLRLVRQLLTESLLLAVSGGAVGILFAYWGKDLLLALRPWGGSDIAIDLKLDLRVLGFTTAISILTGVLFGLAPAFRATRIDVAPALKDSTVHLVGSVRSLISKGLIIGQVGISLVLLIGAGLFVRTLRNLENIDAGFNRGNLVIFRIDPRLSGYKTGDMSGLYQRIQERLEAIPGVTSATLSRHPLLSGSLMSDQVSVQGHIPQPGDDGDVTINVVSSNFFSTLDMPVLLGRGLNVTDDQAAARVAVINQTFARKYFENDSPVGRRFGFGGPDQAGDIEIVGVSKDAKYDGLRSKIKPTVFVPYLQRLPRQVNFSVRTRGDAAAMILPIRQAIHDLDKNLPLFDIKTEDQQVDEILVQERLFARLSGFFGLLALLLSSIGIYGVMSYNVARRTNEMGIRMALGALRGDVIRLVLRETLVLVVVGLALGLGAALLTTTLISKMLYGLAPNDPFTIAFSIFVLISIAALAGYLPARRAAKIDPMVALRYE